MVDPMTFKEWWYDYRIKNGISGTAVAKETVAQAAWLAAIDKEAIEMAAQILEYRGGENDLMVASNLRAMLKATPKQPA